MWLLNTYTAYIIVVITALVIYLRRRFTYWSRHGVPGPNFFEWQGFFTIHHDWTVRQMKRYGRIYGSYGLFTKNINIFEPDLLRDIMVKDFHIFPDRKDFHTGSSKINLSLFFLPGRDDWKRIRSILSPTFTSGKLKSMMANISDISDKFVINLEKFAEKDKIFNIREYVGAFAMDVITACAYGINIESINNPNHPIVVNAKRILNVDFGLGALICVLAPPIARYLKIEFFDINAVNYFDDLTNKVVEERKKSNITINQNTKPKRSDFLQLMIDTEKSDKELDMESISDDESFTLQDSDINTVLNTQKSNKTLSTDELTAQSILFFIAGYDTTSAAISNCIYYLCQNKECQQRLYEELQTINDFSYETLNKLKYLNGVINETLRLAPSLTRIDRECIEDYKLGNTGITLPAGTSVSILPYALHRDPELFPEPELFKPERFIKDSGEVQHHPYAYIPFGGGLRSCIGMRFALNEMRMCIAKLIHKFEFKLAPNFKIEYFVGNVFITPKTLMVNIETRNKT